MSTCAVRNDSSRSTDEEGGSRFTPGQRVVLLLLLGAGFMLSVDFSILNVALPEAGSGVGLRGGPVLLDRRRVRASGCRLHPVVRQARRHRRPTQAVPGRDGAAGGRIAAGWDRRHGALLLGGFTVGALLGGVLVSTLGWRAAFFVNVPVAITIMVVTPLVVAESVRPQRSRLDVPGAVTVTGGLLALVYGIVERQLGAAVVGVVLLAAFVVIELRADAPLVPLRILRRPTVKWGDLAGFAIFATEPAMISLNDAVPAGDPASLPAGHRAGVRCARPGVGQVGVLAGRIVGRVGAASGPRDGDGGAGPRDHSAAGGRARTGGAGDRGAGALLVGFFRARRRDGVTITVTATSGLPDGEQGLATGFTSMTQQIAVTVGIPVLTRRAKTVSEIGKRQPAMGVSHYDPSREAEMLTALERANKEPFSNETIKALFREIFRASLEMEETQSRAKIRVQRHSPDERTVIRMPDGYEIGAGRLPA